MDGVMKPMSTCAPSELKSDQGACDLQLGDTGIEDLPESCIAHVLCFLSTKDIAISACTNRAFRGASLSDAVWQAKLPKDYTEVLAKAKDGARAFDSKKQIFDYLCSTILLHGHELYRLLESPAGVCRGQGAEALDLGSDGEQWDWLQRGGSSYDKSAYLNASCALNVKGSMECSLPVGTYTLEWRFALDDTSYAFNRARNKLPVEFAMSVNDHVTVKSYGFFPDLQSLSEATLSSDEEDQEERDIDWNEYYSGDYYSGDFTGEEGDSHWNTYYVGDFTVEEGEEHSGMGRVKLDYSFVHNRRHYTWKRGLWLDGVVIMPRTRNAWMVS
ncbi:hypothetical protein MPTK2_8g03620 [Marchantia polymorpha subsp. ruderalis]